MECSMKGTKCGFTVHDQEQICQNNRDQVHIFSDLKFGIDALTTGSRLNTQAELQHGGIYALMASNLCIMLVLVENSVLK